MTHPRRDPAVLTCDKTYLIGIEKTGEYPCDITSGNCVWKGYFSAILYNAVAPVYTWSSTLGTIQDVNAVEMELWINSAFEESFEVSVHVTCPTCGDHSVTVSFETSVCDGPC